MSDRSAALQIVKAALAKVRDLLAATNTDESIRAARRSRNEAVNDILGEHRANADLGLQNAIGALQRAQVSIAHALVELDKARDNLPYRL